MEHLIYNTPVCNDVSPVPVATRGLVALGGIVRSELMALGRAVGGVLAHAFAVGDALNQAKKLVGHGYWLEWLATECGLSDRTARAYMRLANHQEVLEANRQHAADLSVRAALRLIGTGQTARKRRPASTLKTTDWKAATPSERAAFVITIPLVEWLEVIPAPWRLEIVDRVDGLRASQAKLVSGTH